MTAPEFIPGVTTHRRRGGPDNAFRYSVDYVLIDPRDTGPLPLLFSRNRYNLMALHDRDHGGRPGHGEGLAWARLIFEKSGVCFSQNTRVLLLAQPRFAGYGFNPVSFWLAMEGDELLAVIAEVNNPFGDRHSYLCARSDRAPIQPGDRLTADKVFHVSPFQRVAGTYRFGFKIQADRIAISIVLDDGDHGLAATLAGPRQKLTNHAILISSLRRPAGALRTIALIYWQALKLKLKGARYRTRSEPPTTEVT